MKSSTPACASLGSDLTPLREPLPHESRGPCRTPQAGAPCVSLETARPRRPLSPGAVADHGQPRGGTDALPLLAPGLPGPLRSPALPRGTGTAGLTQRAVQCRGSGRGSARRPHLFRVDARLCVVASK